MTEVRGATNAKAKRELGWPPRYSSWRQGFRAAHGAGPAPERRRRVTLARATLAVARSHYLSASSNAPTTIDVRLPV